MHWRNGVEWLARFSFQLKRMSKFVMNIVFWVYVWYNSHLMQSRVWRNWIVKKPQFKCKNILQTHCHKINNRAISTINEIHCIDTVLGKFVKSYSFGSKIYWENFVERLSNYLFSIVFFLHLIICLNHICCIYYKKKRISSSSCH